MYSDQTYQQFIAAANEEAARNGGRVYRVPSNVPRTTPASLAASKARVRQGGAGPSGGAVVQRIAAS